jgi:glutathione S-transferase
MTQPGVILQEGKKYVAGDELSHGDMALFCALSNMRSGLIDGESCIAVQAGFSVARMYNDQLSFYSLNALHIGARCTLCEW